MKKNLVFILCFNLFIGHAQSYTPTAANLKARTSYQDMKFGMFIHWGIASVLGDDMWAMNDKKILKKDYMRLISVYNPKDFNAAAWVSTAKQAGAKYIVFITKHHDGFANWDTKVSDWKITNTAFKQDPLKLLAAECKKQGIKLGLYYSTLDWNRNDYPHETGRTGQHTGRIEKSDYASYLKYVKNQLTELLTNYGEIVNIWFDGHWDQTNPEGSADRTSRIDWKYNEIYGLIHQLQPQCLIGNNHHLAPFDGEDFQMFEQDLPGQNSSGLNFQTASSLPLEACVTLNDSWGFRINDTHYKTVNQVIHTLVESAGRNSNLLLNVGPMANGEIQKEFRDTLETVGKWVKQFGHTIYGTRGGPLAPQVWGVTTQNKNFVFVHLLKPRATYELFLPGQWKVKNVYSEENHKTLSYVLKNNGISIDTKELSIVSPDTIITIELK